MEAVDGLKPGVVDLNHAGYLNAIAAGARLDLESICMGRQINYRSFTRLSRSHEIFLEGSGRCR